MIPQDYITEWRSTAPWTTQNWVEQDLVVSRAMVEIFSHPWLRDELAMRGGTAIHKLLFKPSLRYSEDIDLVRRSSGPVKPLIDALRELFAWLGAPRCSVKRERIVLIFRFLSEEAPPSPLRLKVEINTVEAENAFPLISLPYSVTGSWFSQDADLFTYKPEELFGTKLRALYQRKKGRDLFDLDIALRTLSDLKTDQILHCFAHYLKLQGLRVSRAQFESNLAEKRKSRVFRDDLLPLLPAGRSFDIEEAMENVQERLIRHLPGKPWKGQKSESS